jgi:hypothetical protein
MPLRSYKTNNPIQKIVPETREFSMVDWTRLPGGNDCDKPNVSCYVTYAQNAAATTANDWYQFTQDGSRVGYDWQELLWNLDKKNAIMITHLGMLPHQNIRYLRLYRSGRAIENVHYVGPDVCNFPMPAQPYTTADGYAGPAKLARNYLVWNEKGSIEVKDNGTSVAAWSASDVGTMIAVYGKEYELTGE